jgi:HrpA-like RNA helicase
MLKFKKDKDNFVTGKPFTDEFVNDWDANTSWTKLPVYENKDASKRFFNLLKSKTQVILITSGTGSGKTVVIPKYLLYHNIKNEIEGAICITNPKILTTQSSALYSAKTLDVKIGQEIGYRYKGSPRDSYNKDTKLLYLTDGTLLSILLHKNDDLKDFNTIVIDEAHERHIQIDFLLLFIKDILKRRSDFKLVIMSATINADTFMSYFDGNIEQIDISGKPNYPIEQRWMKTTSKDYLADSVKLCTEIINDQKNKKSKENDIIVFVPVKTDTVKGCDMIAKLNQNFYCSQVYSGMDEKSKEIAISRTLYKEAGEHDTEDIIKMKSNLVAKVIFATNVAESSLTIDGIKHVIDSGLELQSYFDQKNIISKIKKGFTSQAQIKQRIGRTGRTCPGISYHLYTEKDYNSFNKYPSPEIQKSDISEYMLLMLSYVQSISKLKSFLKEMIDPPLPMMMDYSLHKMLFNKIISDTYSDTDGELLELGNMILNLKVGNILSSLAIIYSHYYNCRREMLIIISIIEALDGKVMTMFSKKMNKKKLEKEMINLQPLSKENSDHITLLRLYKKRKDDEINILFDGNQIKKIKKYKTMLYRRSKDLNYDKLDFSLEDETVKNLPAEKRVIKCLELAFKYNLAKNKQTINYLIKKEGKIEFLPFTKTNYAKCSKNYIFHDIVELFGKTVYRYVTFSSVLGE